MKQDLKWAVIDHECWIKELGLLEIVIDALVNPSGFTNNLVNAADDFEEKHLFSHSADVVCGLTLTFIIEAREFIHVLHDGRDHALTGCWFPLLEQNILSWQHGLYIQALLL